MSNKNRLFIVLGIIVIIAVSFIIGLFIGQKNAPKADVQITKTDNSIPLKIEIREILGAKSEREIKKYTLNKEEMYVIFNIIDNLTFSNETCDGMATHIISFNSEEKEGFLNYAIEMYDTETHIYSGLGEARITGEQKEQIDKIISKLYN